MQASVKITGDILKCLQLGCQQTLCCILRRKAWAGRRINVTAVATRDTGTIWNHKHLPFCLAGIHIRRSSALDKPTRHDLVAAVHGSLRPQTQTRDRVLREEWVHCMPRKTLTHYPRRCAWSKLNYHFTTSSSLEPSTHLRIFGGRG